MYIRRGHLPEFDAKVMDIVLSMTKTYATDMQIARQIGACFPMYRNCSAGNVQNLRMRHNIESGTALRTKLQADILRNKFDAICADINAGMSDDRIHRRTGLAVYRIARIRVQMVNCGQAEPHAAVDFEERRIADMTKREAQFAALIRKTGRDYSNNVHTKVYGRQPQMASTGLVMTQTSAGSCADAA